MENKIEYPYIPEGREIKYVSLDNEFIQEAKKVSEESGCAKQATGAVVVKEGKIIGKGSNAGKRVEECPRGDSPTGTNYGPCKDVCEQKGHAEVTSVEDAITSGNETKGADLYLYGHWWCCKPCWDKMIGAGIKDVYLLENSQNIFNPENKIKEVREKMMK